MVRHGDVKWCGGGLGSETLEPEAVCPLSPRFIPMSVGVEGPLDRFAHVSVELGG